MCSVVHAVHACVCMCVLVKYKLMYLLLVLLYTQEKLLRRISNNITNSSALYSLNVYLNVSRQC